MNKEKCVRCNKPLRAQQTKIHNKCYTLEYAIEAGIVDGDDE